MLMVCAGLILFSSTRLAGLGGEWVYHHFLNRLSSFQVAQKSVHVILFVIFGCVCYQVLATRSRAMRFAITVLAALIMGAVSETLQIFTGRDPNLADALLNLASGTLGGVFAMALERAGHPRAAEMADRQLFAK